MGALAAASGCNRPGDQPAATEEELAGLLTDSGLFQEGGAFRSQGADLITYVVQYNGVTVAADEEKVPDELRPVLDRLMEILGGP